MTTTKLTTINILQFVTVITNRSNSPRG